jgi:serine/threonine protein kinase
MAHLTICDLGSAGALKDACVITPYLCTRIYRAPEIMMGLPVRGASAFVTFNCVLCCTLRVQISQSICNCTHSINMQLHTLQYDERSDTWSIGCVVYELYTGAFLFDGRDNNAMLRQIFELRGVYAKKLLKRAHFAAHHFSAMLDVFEAKTIDPTTHVVLRKPVRFEVQGGRTQRSLLQQLQAHAGADSSDSSGGGGNGGGNATMMQLRDLLERVLVLDPARRLSVEEGVAHPFFGGATA